MDTLHLTLRQLQIFVAVARHGSTTAAAEAVALSQSAVSTGLAALEAQLGAPLFDRTGRRVVLNEHGRALLPRARALLDGAAGLEQLGRSPEGHIESLRIGASTTLGNYVVPGLLARHLAPAAARRSGWRTAIDIGNTAGICARVAAFDLDIGLVEGPCHEPALRAERWVRDEMVVVAAPGAGLAGGRAAADLAALRAATWLLREPGSGTREAADAALLPRLGTYARSVEIASSEAIKRAAAQGVGLACLSRWVAEDFLAAGRLVALRTPLPRIERQCYWVVHRDKQPTPALERFIRSLGEVPDAAGPRRPRARR